MKKVQSGEKIIIIFVLIPSIYRIYSVFYSRYSNSKFIISIFIPFYNSYLLLEYINKNYNIHVYAPSKMRIQFKL